MDDQEQGQALDECYDVIVCGMGLKECAISCLLALEGYKVLHLDRNAYYGSETASLNITNLYAKFHPGKKPPEEYGANRDWNVDLVPKFVMACGTLVKIILKTKINRYLQWLVVEGSYVYQHQKGGVFSNEKHIHKVPSTEMEALKSPLISLMEKNKGRAFFAFATKWDTAEHHTMKNWDYNKHTMRQVFEHYGLSLNTIDFVGHAIALYSDDSYLDRPMGPTMDKIRLYMQSLARYGSSPYIYPVYGLGGLPDGFARRAAVHGATYILNQPIDSFVYDEQGQVYGVKSISGRVTKCKMILCDPSYVEGSNKVRVTRKVVRGIYILSSPLTEAQDKHSAQIIIPQKQINRKNDIYISVISHTHGVAKEGKYIAIVSTTVETSNPEQELKPALALLGKPEEKFVSVTDVYERVLDGKVDNVFVSESYDATSHFESAARDIVTLWKNMTGKDLDLTNISPDEEEE